MYEWLGDTRNFSTQPNIPCCKTVLINYLGLVNVGSFN